METRFLHTADWQLGKPFASLGDEAKRHSVQQERIRSIQRIATVAREWKADFVLVAGDVFDSSHATKATVSAACAAIGEIKIPVLVIPGNHDHGGPGTIWEQEFFQREQLQLAPNLRVLLSPEPIVLETAILFPAPLLRRHESSDPTAWIRQAAVDSALPSHLPRIILAHGTIQGFGSSPDDEDASPTANWINLSGLPSEAIDYVALGDWHGTKQVAPNAWYSGTPELDRFPKGESNDPGNILKVTATRSKPPKVEKVPLGQLAWKELAFGFSGDASLDSFATLLNDTIGARGDEHLLALVLKGSLGIEAAGRLEQILESWESRLLHLRLDHRVSIAPSEDEIAALTIRTDDPLIASVASQLVARLHSEGEDAAIARLALRELHTALS